MDDAWGAGEPPDSEQLMGLTRAVADGRQVLAVSGDVDALTTPRLTAALRTIFAEHAGESVVLDLSRLGFLGASGLRVLVDMSDEGQRQAVSLQIVTGGARSVVRPIRVTGLDQYLQVFHSIDDALTHRA